MTRHVIAQIRYLPRRTDGAGSMRCSCGWFGDARDWLKHRKEVGAPILSVSATIGARLAPQDEPRHDAPGTLRTSGRPPGRSQRVGPDGLTDRQREIEHALALYGTPTAVARHLGIAVSTVLVSLERSRRARQA